MTGRLVTDEPWNEVESLFPIRQQTSKGGRRPINNRTVFTSLVFLLKPGTGWRDLPTEMGASQCTVRRRLKTWTEAGLWEAIAQHLLTRLRAAGRLDLAEVLVVAV